MGVELGGWGICAATLYDKPADHFGNVPDREPHRTRLGISGFSVISSTSWTPDENFDLLVQAFDILDKWEIPVNLYITGKGPLKAEYEAMMAGRWRNCVARTMWLEPEDYPIVLSIADIGV
jgi:glycosyltransferase involved in cell wall biosynthesis